jgi:FHS family L-fucose permease-like MFS transporter
MKKTFPIFLVFLCMGFGDVVGPLVGLAKDTFQLSYTMAQLLPLAGFIMFGILSVPMGIYQDKKGKKKVLLIGLIVAFIGLFIPLFNGMYGIKIQLGEESRWQFYILLASIMFLVAGATILQVVGNPIMRDVSPSGEYSRNLTFAQFIKAIGSSFGFLLPPLVAIAFDLEWSVLFPVFSGLILVTLLLIIPLKVNEYKYPDSRHATITSCLSLLKNRYILFMVMTIFLYVGAEVSMSSGVPILLKENFGITGFSLWISWVIFFLPILLGRFTGSQVLKWIPAKKFLIVTVILSIIGILSIFTLNEILTYIGVVLVGLGFANIFPLVFSLTIDYMPERSNELSGLMITAIAGGAIVPLIMGNVADHTSVSTGFIVPLICLGYIAFTSFYSYSKTQPD